MIIKSRLTSVGSVAPARVKICGSQAAQTLQDLAAERCSMPYKAPELFNVESYCMVDERTDIWVRSIILNSKYLFLILIYIEIYVLFQSLGCILYALCYFKSPFDAVYERGDSVALAVMSANITFPEDAPYTEVQ